VRNLTSDSLARVPASGWRGNPWIYRIGAIVGAIIVTAMALLLLGVPTSLEGGIGFGAVYLIVLAYWLPYELMAEREVAITPSGVWFRYLTGDHFVPWDKLEVSQRVRRPWLNAVGVFETKGGLIKRRVHTVTLAQAHAITDWMQRVSVAA
jgi:hypothetical protein